MSTAASRPLRIPVDTTQAADWFVAASTIGIPAIAYAFTVGVMDAIGAELLVAGVDPETAFKIFNRLLRTHRGVAMAPEAHGRRIDGFSGGYPVVLRDLPPEAAERSALRSYIVGPARMIQIVLSDRFKRFPWHQDVDPAFSAEQCAFADWRREGKAH